MYKIITESYGLDKDFPNFSCQLGRGLRDRLQTLWDNLSEKEKYMYKEHFERYARNSGIIFEIDPKNPERIARANEEYDDAIKYLDRIFFLKFGEHLFPWPITPEVEDLPKKEADME